MTIAEVEVGLIYNKNYVGKVLITHLTAKIYLGSE
jgi:hypothetical protein